MSKKLVIIITALGMLFWFFMLGIGSFTILMPTKRDINLPYYLPVILENAHGIQIGTRVNILGVDQGYIKYIDYFPTDKQDNLIFISECKDLCREIIKEQIILIILNIRKNVEFYENYKLYSRYDRIIGQKVIEINPGNKFEIKKNKKIYYKKLDVKYLTSNEVLNIMLNQKINLNKKYILSSTNYDDPITIIAQLIYENRYSLKRIFKNTADITGKINSGNGTLSILLNENEIHSNTDKALLETIFLIQVLREILESLRENKIVSKTLNGTLTTILPQNPNRRRQF